ncbi:MAG TPA: MBL fold metallo-hydrolase [Kofleriaceae bacterium]|jgi:glyoxylase-like metal-dependent hydrolase (beta-lactamase superfamily II)
MRSAWTILLAALACAGGDQSAAPTATTRRPAAPAPHLEGEVRIGGELVARELAPGAYLVTHVPFHSSNVLVVRMADASLVVCSSPFETEGTRALLRWLEATFHPPRIVAINTHFHLDGTGGNAAYAEAGVETIASRQTAALLAERGPALRDGAAAAFEDAALRARVAGVELTAPRRTFDAAEGLTLTIAGEEVRVIHPGAAHSPDNVVVHFPARGILFGGCMIKSRGASIGYTGDADLGHWEAAVHSLERLAPRIVVPGHGAPGGAELFAGTIEIVRAARVP